MKINRRLLTLCLMFLSSALLGMEQDNDKVPLSLVDQCSMRIAHYLLQAQEVPSWFKPDLLPAKAQAKVLAQLNKASTLWLRLKDNVVSFGFKGGHNNTPDTVVTVAISNNNKFIVTGSTDNTACIWEAQTGTLKHVLKGHTGPIRTAAISNDSSFIVTSSNDNTARIWGTQGQCFVTLKGHTGLITSLVISNDSRFIATGSVDGTVRLWNILGECIAEFKSNTADSNRGIMSVVISKDSDFIVSVSASGFIRAWNIKDKALKYEFNGNAGQCVALTNDNKCIIVGCGSVLYVLSSQDGTVIYKINDSKQIIHSVAISNDNSFIVTGCEGSIIRIYNAQDGTFIRELDGCYEGNVASVVISRDNSLILSGSNDYNLVQLWDVAKGNCLLDVKREDFGLNRLSLTGVNTSALIGLNRVALSSDASIIVTCMGVHVLKDLQKANILKNYIISNSKMALASQPLE